jgi:hypothetical protein
VRRQLPPPADRPVYELTETGRALEDVVDAYVRWGRRLIEERDPGDVVRPQWLERAVRTFVRPDRQGVDLTLALRTPEALTVLHIDDDGVQSVDPSTPADVTLAGPVEDLAAALDPRRAATLVADERVTVTGARPKVRQLATLFSEAWPSAAPS